MPKRLSTDPEKQSVIRASYPWVAPRFRFSCSGSLSSTEEMAFHVLETFNWHLRRATFPSLPPPVDYQDLCSNFILSDAKVTALDFLLPEIVQVVFYTMVINDALELGVLSRDLAELLKSALVDLQWSTFEVWLRRNRDNLLRAYCPGPVSP
ncbi:hypothetical protein Cgig2_012998 [Carnegiea gigantea]|uniref:Uncharacterized protein n=1 Tax=Carnegiea gigantea TaxID=171969 RepID=A0A9Q1QEC5_9CARY|nr:hypothetical protein Cgig2_012998 [Carnegiea gigantea]